MRPLVSLILFFVASTAASNEPSITATLSGRVVGVTDGDTVRILVDKTTLNVRLEGIDAPESGQPFGSRARHALSAMVFGQIVIVQKTGEDRFQRTLGVVFKDDVSINAAMIEDGFAWHYTEYSKDRQLAELERKARMEKQGLWSDPNPVAPWDYRRLKRTHSASKGTGEYWINTTSNVRHNSTCDSFRNTQHGRICSKGEGRACGRCGG
jgi:endonuclease YncB( thermonuclease family)